MARRTRASNPAWSDRLIASNWSELDTYAKKNNLPMPSSDAKSTRFRELGCGHYGCVLPTGNDDVVLKITSDESEAGIYLATKKIGESPNGMLKDFGMVPLDGTFRRRKTFAIWKERAIRVGAMRDTDVEVKRAVRRLDVFKSLASIVRNYDVKRPGSVGEIVADDDLEFEESDLVRGYERDPRIVVRASVRRGASRIGYALSACRFVAEVMSQEPEFNLVGETLLWFMHYGILLADVHGNNVGEVIRPENFGEPVWVITDPGHAVPIRPMHSYVVDDVLPKTSIMVEARMENPTAKQTKVLKDGWTKTSYGPGMIASYDHPDGRTATKDGGHWELSDSQGNLYGWVKSSKRPTEKWLWENKGWPRKSGDPLHPQLEKSLRSKNPSRRTRAKAAARKTGKQIARGARTTARAVAGAAKGAVSGAKRAVRGSNPTKWELHTVTMPDGRKSYFRDKDDADRWAKPRGGKVTSKMATKEQWHSVGMVPPIRSRRSNSSGYSLAKYDAYMSEQNELNKLDRLTDAQIKRLRVLNKYLDAHWDEYSKTSGWPNRSSNPVAGCNLRPVSRPKGVSDATVEQGIQVELEHTTDRRVARKIAYHHLHEDKAYYKKLKKMEAGFRHPNPTNLRKGMVLMQRGVTFTPGRADIVHESKGGHVTFGPLHPNWYRRALGKGRPMTTSRAGFLDQFRIVPEDEIERFRGADAKKLADEFMQHAKDEDARGYKESADEYRMKARETIKMYGTKSAKTTAKKRTRSTTKRSPKKNPVTEAARKRMKPSEFALPKQKKYAIDSGPRANYALTLLNQHYRNGSRTKAEYTEAFVNIMKAFRKYGKPATRPPLVRTERTLAEYKKSKGKPNPTKKAPAKKRIAKKAPAKKRIAKKAPAKKRIAKKAPAKKRVTKKARAAAKKHMASKGLGSPSPKMKLAMANVDKSAKKLGEIYEKIGKGDRSQATMKRLETVKKVHDKHVKAMAKLMYGGKAFPKRASNPSSTGVPPLSKWHVEHRTRLVTLYRWNNFMVEEIPQPGGSGLYVKTLYVNDAKRVGIQHRVVSSLNWKDIVEEISKRKTKRVAKKSTAKKAPAKKRVAKKAPAKKQITRGSEMLLTLGSVGTGVPEHAKGISVVKHQVKVKSLQDASKKATDFIRANGLYGSNWFHAGIGDVSKGGKVVARVSYNGSVWPPGGWVQGRKPLYDPWPEERLSNPAKGPKIKAVSFERYNGGIAIKRRFGSSTITKFYVSIDGVPDSQRIVEGYGKTPGERKTYAISSYKATNPDLVAKAPKASTRKAPTKRSTKTPTSVPKVQIEMIVGNLHVGTPDSDVRAGVETRARKAGANEKLIKACGDYAVKVHHKNRELYKQVMSGRFRNPTKEKQFTRRVTTGLIKSEIKDGRVVFGESATGQFLSVGPYHKATSKREMFAVFIGNRPHEFFQASDAAAHFMALTRPDKIKYRNPVEKRSAKKSAKKKNPIRHWGSWAKVREALLSVPNAPTNYGLTVQNVKQIGETFDWEGRWSDSGWSPGTKEYDSLPAMIKAEPRHFLADISEYYGDDYYPRPKCSKCKKRNPTKSRTTKAKLSRIPKEKIQAVKIELERKEGVLDKAVVEAPNVWVKANQILARWARTAPPGRAYDRTDFIITFADGEKYKGKYEINRMDMTRASLDAHVQKFVKTMAGKYNPGNSTDAEYKNWLKEMKVDSKAWNRFLNNYQFG